MARLSSLVCNEGAKKQWQRGWAKYVKRWQDDVLVTLAGQILALGWAIKQMWDTGLLATRERKRQAEVVLLERSQPVTASCSPKQI